ncbi:EamA family transporter [candidate division GN15 bacterium]|nr:EamA family transporter [candidate division GN15 bacterium]
MILTPGVRYIILSTLFFALMNVGVKYLDHIPAYEVVFFRALVSLVMGYVLCKRAGLNPWGNNKKLLIARGLAGTVALTMYFYTVQQMPLASAVTIQYLSPIFTIIFASVIMREHTRPILWLFFLVSFAGVVMIKGFDPRITPFELTLGVLAAMSSGLAYNFVRKLKDTDHPLVVVFYFPLVTVPVIGPYAVTHWVAPSGSDLVILIAIGIFVTIAQIFMTKGYQLERASNVSNYNYLGSVYALLIGWFFFAESIPPLGIAGIVLIIFGVIMSSRFRQEG